MTITTFKAPAKEEVSIDLIFLEGFFIFYLVTNKNVGNVSQVLHDHKHTTCTYIYTHRLF